jgi:hypothetical protein
MPKKATAKTKAATPEAPPSMFQQMDWATGGTGELLDHRAFAHRSPGSQEHVNQPFDVNAYDLQRPAEADPKTWEKIFDISDNWYQKNGLIRNIIDLMADFCVAGIQISSSDPSEQAVLRKWFEKVDVQHVSERIANMLYRLGNVGIRKQYTDANINLKKKWKDVESKTKVEIKIPDYIRDKAVLPYKYITIPPQYIKVPRPEVSAFLDEPYYALKISNRRQRLVSLLDNEIKDDDFMKQMPADMQKALGGETVQLDNSLFTMLHYKKDDFDKRYAFPLIYAALSDLALYSKMMLADRNVVDSAIKNITFVKVGDTDKGIMPTIEYLDELADKVNKAGTAGSKTYFVVPPYVDLVKDTGTLAAFLGKEKFNVVLEAIYSTFGIPAALTGTASGAAANNFMSMKVLIKKLEYVRQILQKFWNEEVKQVHAACNLRSPFFITFTYQELGDEAAIKKLIEDMYDRDVISDETYRYMMGVPHDLEEWRVDAEWKQRQAGTKPPKADPFHNGNFATEAMKIDIQGGNSTPEYWGVKPSPVETSRKTRLDLTTDNNIRQSKEQHKLDLDHATHQNELDITYENSKPQPTTTTTETPTTKVTKKSVKKVSKKGGSGKKATKKQSGVPGQGRPKNSPDSKPRKERTYKRPRKT